MVSATTASCPEAAATLAAMNGTIARSGSSRPWVQWNSSLAKSLTLLVLRRIKGRLASWTRCGGGGRGADALGGGRRRRCRDERGVAGAQGEIGRGAGDRRLRTGRPHLLFGLRAPLLRRRRRQGLARPGRP